MAKKAKAKKSTAKKAKKTSGTKKPTAKRAKAAPKATKKAAKKRTAKAAVAPARKVAKKKTAPKAAKQAPVRKAAQAAVTPQAAAPMGDKLVYFFGDGKADGNGKMKALLGGKGANLAEMTRIGIPVPAGYTITTEVCTYFQQHDSYPPKLESQIRANLRKVERIMGMEFGNADNPLLVSVRSGARASMPGMMDTVLNLGLNDRTVQGWIRKTSNERAGWDSYRRFVQMYGDVVMGLKPEGRDEEDPFEVVLARKKYDRVIKDDTALSVTDLQELVVEFKDLIRRRLGQPFPEDPMEQLWGAIGAVFRSWNGARAVAYRRLEGIPDDWGTAVNVQAMVFGNMGNDSATGVAFTRDPSTGEKKFYGEYLPNAQGEDVVAGVRTPLPINEVGKTSSDQKTLEKFMPGPYKKLDGIRKKLEAHYRDMQDIEFTIQNGRLWMLQTRTGKRTGPAAVRIAVDMVKEKLINKKDAVQRVTPEQLDQLLHPRIDPQAEKTAHPMAKGINASPGAVSGKVVFNADDAVEWARRGEKVILVRIETSPEDIQGMHAAKGILTSRGGATSHAAVVARGMGKACVAGCGTLRIDYYRRQFNVETTIVREGQVITIDGGTGKVYEGELPTIEPEIAGEFAQFMEWVDEFRKLGVRTNADTPHDAKVARDFGAQGIGLCRTEHMFFDADRIDSMRKMILADTKEGREAALEDLLPFQRSDFVGIFKAMAGLPVTIRLLDPPLHEFLPHDEEGIVALANRLGVPADRVEQRVSALHEMNPMLGHRGCRLGTTYPEITAMQARAILEAAVECKKLKIEVLPEIMVPLVGTVGEITDQRRIIDQVADEVFRETAVKVNYLVGTMIEVPRAALLADKIAEHAEFFSFGTNDLTQMTFGYSRDDAGTFLPEYVERGILEDEPFQVLDQEGVGQLVQMGVERGRSTRPKLKIGICGEHGGDPRSVGFCHKVGMDYVSCSPYRVPVARLAAARATLAKG